VSRVGTVADLVRDVVPRSRFADAPDVVHYSIPAFDEVGSAVVVAGSEIDSDKLGVQAGDVLISRLNPRKSRVLVVEMTGPFTVASTEFVVLRPHSASAEYLRFLLGEQGVRDALEREVRSVTRSQQRVDAKHILGTRIPLTDRNKQRHIAQFLVGEEERFATVRQRLGSLAERALQPALARAEQAWVNQPLGKIGYRFEVQLGKKLYEHRIEHATAKPYLRIANVYWDRFVLDDVKVMNFEGHEAAFYALRPGDLLVCEGRGLGRSAVWNGQITPCFFQMSLNRVRPYGLDSTRWVMWCLRVLNRRGTFIGDAPGVPHVTAEQLRATRIPLPSPDIQHRLVAEIDAEAERAQRVSALASRLDERLAEYRDVLITAAVHGQLDPARVSDVELDERLHAATEDLVP
jgi:type I restriction enzyme S subunit